MASHPLLSQASPLGSVRGGIGVSVTFALERRPIKNPFLALSRALVPLLSEGGIVEQLQEIQKLAAGLNNNDIEFRNLLGACRAANLGKRILLIFDQFEEIFTIVDDENIRYHFIDTLLTGFSNEIGNTSPDICLVMTLRADFYGMALRHRPLADALQNNLINLGPMTREELKEAIIRPAGPVPFDDGLVDTILADVISQPGSLPLLQFALREMWTRLEKPRMTFETYNSIGGVKGALELRAQAIYSFFHKKG